MLFRRRQTERVTGPAGPVQHGLEAVLRMESRIGSAVAIVESVYGSERHADNGLSFTRAADAAAYALGRVAGGERASAVVALSGLTEALPTLVNAVDSRLPLVLFVLADGPWDPVFRAGALGAVVLSATDIRDSAALASAAHLAAEDVLLPVVCVLDASRVAHATADIPTGDPGGIETLFSDSRPSGDPAQKLVFGAERPSIPSWIDPDRPVGIGAKMLGRDLTASLAARRLLLDSDVGAIVDRALAMASDACARHLDPVVVHGTERAPVAFVTAGPAVAVPPERTARFKILSCIRLFPFPLEAVLARVGRSRASLLLPVTPGSDTGRLAAGIAHAAGRPVPVGYLPVSYEPDLAADLEAAATSLETDGLADPWFPAAWRRMDRPGLPEAERLEQRLKTAKPGFDRALVGGIGVADAALRHVVFAGVHLGPLVEAELASSLTDITKLAVRSFPLRPKGDAVAVSTGMQAGSEAGGRAFSIAVETTADLDRYGLFDWLGKGTLVVTGDSAPVSAEATVRLRAAGARLARLSTAGSDDFVHPWATALALIGSTPMPETPGPDGPLPTSVPADAARRIVARLAAAGLLPDAHVDALLARIDAAHADEAPVPSAPDVEPLPPSVLKGASQDSDRVDDPLRFWRTIGFAHAAGRTSELVPDPYRAIGILPARAGWAPSGSGTPSSLPAVVAERCTGCGDCWTVCPESAIVPAAPTFEETLDLAFARLDAAGESAFQLGRLRKAIAQEAHRTFAGDAMHQFRTLDALVGEAFERVLIKGKVDDGKRTELRTEFTAVSRYLAPVAIAHTEAWFTRSEGSAKGTGRPLALSIDPDRCSSCGLCVAACSEAALEPSLPEPIDLVRDREAASFCRDLAPVPAGVRSESGIPAAAAQAMSARGVDSVSAADDAATATLHAVALACDAVSEAARSNLLTRAADARGTLETSARKAVSGAVAINDFEAFGKRLAELGENVAPDALLQSVSTGAELDARRLKRLTEAQGALHGLESAWTRGDMGRGRASIVAVFDGDPNVTWPVNPFGFPWIRVASGTGAAAARAVADSIEARHVADISVIRSAELIARDVQEDTTPAVTFSSLDRSERAACPSTVLVTDRVTEGVLALLDEGRRVRVLLLDSDPMHAGDPAIAAAAFGSAFVAQVTLGRPREMASALHAAFAHDGPALVHCLVPDGPVTDAFMRASEAVVSRVFPVFSYEPPSPDHPSGRFDLGGNPAPSADWADDRHDPVSWIARDSAGTRTWRVTERGEEPKGLVPVREALDMTEPATVGLPRPGGRTAIVPEPVLAGSRRRLVAWRRLRAMSAAATRASMPPDSVTPTAPAEVPAPAVPVVMLPPEVHARLTSRLLALSGFAPGDPRAAESLKAITGRGSDAIAASEPVEAGS